MKRSLLFLLLLPVLLYSQEVEYFYNIPIGKSMNEAKKELLRDNFNINSYSIDSLDAVGVIGYLGKCKLKLESDFFRIISKENYDNVKNILGRQYDNISEENNQTMFCLSKFRYLLVENMNDSTKISLLDMTKQFTIRFKGIALGGTLKEILPSLLKEYKFLTQMNGTTTVLTGKFAGYNNCYIYVMGINENDIVSNISVSFPSSEFWNLVYGQYRDLKKSLIEKYGEPVECIENIEETEDMISSLADGKTICKATFQPNGTALNDIMIFISGFKETNNASVMISYTDRLMQYVQNENSKDDL